MHSKLTLYFFIYFFSYNTNITQFWIIHMRSYTENKISEVKKMSLLNTWGSGHVYKILCSSGQVGLLEGTIK